MRNTGSVPEVLKEKYNFNCSSSSGKFSITIMAYMDYSSGKVLDVHMIKYR